LRKRASRWRIRSFVFAASLVAAASWWLARVATGPDAADVAGPSVASASAGSTPLVTLLGLRDAAHRRFGSLADASVYGVEYRLEVVQQIGANRQAARATFTTDITLTPAPHLGPDWVAGRLSAVRVEADPALHAQLDLDEQPDISGFERPFLLRLETGRGVVERRFDPAMARAGESLVATLVSTLQIVEGADPVVWTTREEGPDGPFEADYEASTRQLDKRWRRDDGRSAIAERDAAPVTSTGHTVWHLGALGALSARYEGQLTTRFGTRSATTDLSGQPSLNFTLTAVVTATRYPLHAATDWATALDPATLSPQRFDEQLSASAAPAANPDAGVVAADVVLAQAAVAARTKDWSTRRHATKQLTARAETDDGFVKDLAQRLRGPLGLGVDARTIIEVLASAKSPAARRTFAGLLNDSRVPETHRQLVATTATFVAPPTDALLSALVDASEGAGLDEAATAALLALGGQAQMMAETDPARSQAIGGALRARAVHFLRPDLARDTATKTAGQGSVTGGDPVAPLVPLQIPGSATLGQVMVWLDAVGNAGGAEAWPLIAPWLGASDQRVRRRAVDNLRFIPTREARLALAETMETEPDAWVRRAAVTACQYQPQVAFEEPLLRVLATDRSAPVRLGAATALARWGYTSPVLYEAIAKAAAREGEPNLKRSLLALLPTDHSAAAEGSP
jgi:hypothetical protein